MTKSVLKTLAHPLLLALPLANKLALATASLSFLCCLLVILSSQQQLKTITSNNLDMLGNELSEQLALNARPALIQGNTLSLQAMLEELNQSDRILHAAIFNLDNKPIAESGAREDGKAYMAPIHFQDTIAGHSLVVMDEQLASTQSSGLLMQQLLLSLLFTGCCYALVLWGSGKLSHLLKQLEGYIASPNYPANTRRIQSTYIGDDEFQALIQRILSGPNLQTANTDASEAALVQIDWQQADCLSQDELKQLKQQLNSICKLYEGKLQLSRPNSFSAVFYQAKDNNEHPFKALCCAKIIEQLLNEKDAFEFQIKVLLGHAVCEFSLQTLIQKAEQWQCQSSLNISSEILEHNSVNKKLDQASSDSEISLTHSYSELINRQLSALRHQFLRQAE